jgi:hypothetical protein
MLYKNRIFGKALKATFGVVALLSVTGGLVSCDVGGEESGGDDTEQQGEENEQGDKDD